MSDNKKNLPNDWVERFSRSRRRGQKYYFNVKTKERTWEHPKISIQKRRVADWMDIQTTSFDGMRNSQFDWKLEQEYLKFEKSVAEIEIETAKHCGDSEASETNLEDDNSKCVGKNPHHTKVISVVHECATQKV